MAIDISFFFQSRIAIRHLMAMSSVKQLKSKDWTRDFMEEQA